MSNYEAVSLWIYPKIQSKNRIKKWDYDIQIYYLQWWMCCLENTDCRNESFPLHIGENKQLILASISFSLIMLQLWFSAEYKMCLKAFYKIISHE